MSDGVVKDPVPGEVAIRVMAVTAAEGVPPVAEPDAMRGTIGQRIDRDLDPRRQRTAAAVCKDARERPLGRRSNHYLPRLALAAAAGAAACSTALPR